MKSFIVLGLLNVCAAAACSGSHSNENETTASVAQADTTQELIGPSTCTARANRLVACAIPAQTLNGLTIETAVPLRTVMTVNKSGNCSTQYPLEVTFGNPGEPDVKLQYLSTPSVTLRRRDAQAIALLTMKDSSPWTKVASLDASCRVTVSQTWNEPDVDSKDQAQAIIDALSKDLASKTLILQRYSDLIQYKNAFDFLNSIVNNLYTELTNDAMQMLRGDAKAAKPTLMKLVNTDACGGTLSDDDLTAVISLYESLAVIGSPESWQTDGGTTKTLADYLGSEADAIVSLARKLSQAHSTDAGGDYATEYKQSAADVARAQNKLDLAKAQLAKWLT